MSENQHYIKAVSRLHNGTNNEVARAHVEATLAVAFEQRTANLIALIQPIETANGNVIYMLTEQAEKILDQINERLGL